MKKLIKLFLPVLVIILLSGCNSTGKQLIGSWYETNGYIRLDVDKQCTVNYYVNSADSVSKAFEYNVNENEFVLMSDENTEVPLTMTFEDDIVTELIYTVDDDVLVFTKEEVEPAPSFEDLLSSMNDAQGAITNKDGEQDGQDALNTLLAFGKVRKLNNLVEGFMNKLSPGLDL